MSIQKTFVKLAGAAALAMILGAGAPARAETGDLIEGPVVALDGDTLFVGGVKVRLWGLSAFEADTRAGMHAAGALADLIDPVPVAGAPLPVARCVEMDRDRYKRPVAVCRVGNMDLTRWMIELGQGMAYRFYTWDPAHPERHALARIYDAAERSARRKRLGFWYDYRGPSPALLD